MSDARSRLFHAIVGLGIAASGCGKVLPSTLGEAGDEHRPVDAGQDHFIAPRDVGVEASISLLPPDAGVDATKALDAAYDVFMPPPTPPVK